MNDYSYSSAPPSEASAAAAAAYSTRCQSTIDNVTRWLQQHDLEKEVDESRTNLFEAELTRRLAMLRATGTNTPSSLSRNVSEQSIARPDQVASPSFPPPMAAHLARQPFSLREMGCDRNAPRILSTASSSANKRQWDTCPAGSSKQPRISDPTLATDIPFQPTSSSASIAVNNNNNNNNNEVGMLTPPSSAANSMDNAPPLPPRESAASSLTVIPNAANNETAPPLPPRPAGLVTSGIELHMSSPAPSTSSNIAISFHVSNTAAKMPPNNANTRQVFFDGRGYTMPPAPPGSVSSSSYYPPPDFRVLSLPQGAARTNSSRQQQQPFLPSRPIYLNNNGNPVALQFWSQPMSSAGMSTTSQSHAFSNLNYSVFPEYSQQNGPDNSQTMSNCGSISFNGGSNYGFYDQMQPQQFGGGAPGLLDMDRISLNENNPQQQQQQQQISSRHFYVQAPPSQLQRRAQTIVTSPLPERRQRNSARLEDGTIVGLAGMRESYSNSRNYSSEAYKFFMEQHIENLVKSCQQRKERQHQFDAFMTSQNLNSEAERRPFRVLNAKRESNYLRLKRARLTPSFFEPLKTLGVGAFGEVTLVRKRDNNKFYAMKTLRKADVIKRNQVAHVKAERDILAEANSDWVVKLFFSFQDRENLYFIMDYIPGGDLMNLLIKKGIFPEVMARFYTAELVAALEYVHSMGFIHRDIKPDNVLIDREGHVKLTDFGLCTGFRWTHQSNRYAKIRPEEPIWLFAPQNSHVETPETANTASLTLPHRHRRVHSLVGTPNYIAPEVVLKSGYNHSCDWWSVGVILYEMLVGRPPFLSETPAETQYKIIHWKQYLSFQGASLSQTSADLISALIRDADSRLGAFGGAADIKAHPFFASIDFENLRKQPSVYVPFLKNDLDTSNFDPSLQGGHPSFSEQNGPGVATNSAVGPAAFSFYEFTFRRFCDDAGCPLPLPLSLNAALSSSSSSMMSPCGTTSEPTSAQPAVQPDPSAVTAKPPLPPPLPPRPGASSQQQTKQTTGGQVGATTPTAGQPKPLPPPVPSSTNHPSFV